MVQTMTCLHPCSSNHRWSPLEVHQGLFFSLNIKVIERSRKIDLRNTEFHPWSNKITKYVISLHESCLAPRSGLGSRAPPTSSVEVCWNYCLRSPPALYTAVDNGCLSCNISPVLHGNTNSFFFFFFLSVQLFCFEPFYVNFIWWHCSEIFKPVQLPSAFKASPINIPRRTLCRTDALDLGLLQIESGISLLFQKK